MKKYWVVDDATSAKGEVFAEKYNTVFEALRAADREYNALTDREKNARYDFFVCAAAETDDGCIDLDTADEIKNYLSGRQLIGTIETDAGEMKLFYNGTGEEITGEIENAIEKIEYIPKSFDDAVDAIHAMYKSDTWALQLAEYD